MPLPKIWNDYDRLDAADLNADFAYLVGRLTPLAYVEAAANVAVAASSPATATTILTAPAIVVAAGDVLEVVFSSPGAQFPASPATRFNLDLWEDATDLGMLLLAQPPVSGWVPLNGRGRITPAPGSHIYSVRGWVTPAASVTVSAGAGGPGTARPMSLTIRYAGAA